MSHALFSWQLFPREKAESTERTVSRRGGVHPEPSDVTAASKDLGGRLSLGVCKQCSKTLTTPVLWAGECEQEGVQNLAKEHGKGHLLKNIAIHPTNQRASKGYKALLQIPALLYPS